MPTKHWKNVEREYCRALNSDRRGADYGDLYSGGKNDCADGCAYSVEIRHRRQISFKDIVDQVRKAEERATDEQVPISISHIPGTPIDSGIVSMSFGTFRQWYVGVSEHLEIGE